MANNLEQQGGIWHVRLAIPVDVQKAFSGRKILTKSLETGLRSEAMNRRLPYLSQWKAEIAAARLQAKAPKPDWRPELAAIGAAVKQEFDARFLNALNPPEASIKIPVIPASGRWAGVAAGLDAAMPNDIVKLKDVAQFSRDLMSNLASAKHGMTTAEADEARALIFNPSSYKPKSPITTARLEAFRKYREARAISPKNIDAQESKLNKLSEFLAASGKPLDFDCVSAWLDSITAASKTKTQYLNAGNTFWKWAIQNDARWKEDYKGAITPFERHDLPQLKGKAKRDAQRVAFEVNEIPTLYAAAQGKKLHALADLILLGAYTGARIEELCQLRTENVIDDEGVQSFDIVDSKTVAGIRTVPVHPALAALVKRLVEESKDGYLVPCDAKNKYEIRSDLMSKAFGRLKKQLGFDNLHVFHSLRMTAITQLVRASVAGTIIAELVGHETGTVTYDVYNQGHSAVQKLEAISKLPTLATA